MSSYRAPNRKCRNHPSANSRPEMAKYHATGHAHQGASGKIENCQLPGSPIGRGTPGDDSACWFPTSFRGSPQSHAVHPRGTHLRNGGKSLWLRPRRWGGRAEFGIIGGKRLSCPRPSLYRKIAWLLPPGVPPTGIGGPPYPGPGSHGGQRIEPPR